MTEKPAPALALRDRLLDAMLAEADAQGWNSAAFAAAAKRAGLTAGEAQLAAPRGPLEMIEAFADRLDSAMAADLAEEDLASMKIRDRVRLAVRKRIELVAPYKQAARRAAARLALQRDGLLAAKLTWATADAIWRALGDQSTDGNFYSKRAILSGVYASTLGLWLMDQSPDARRTWDFLDARIENVMQFEKFKATRLRPLGFALMAGVGELAKWRYREEDPVKPA